MAARGDLSSSSLRSAWRCGSGRCAVRAQARAEQRFNDTRQLANALIFKIHDAVAPLAGSTPVRQTIVSEALAYLERLERGVRRRRVAAARAVACLSTDRVHSRGIRNTANLGNRDEALKQYEKARRLGRPLALTAERRSGRDLQSRQHRHVDEQRSTSGRRASSGAARLAQEAVDQAQRVVRPHRRHRRLAHAARRGALRARVALSPDAGVDSALGARASSLRAGSRRRRRTTTSISAMWRSSASTSGRCYETAGRDDEAGAHYLRARRSSSTNGATPADPDNRLTQFDLAVSLSSLATDASVRATTMKPPRSIRRSLEIRQRLADSDPKDVLGQGRVGYVQMRLALVEIDARARDAGSRAGAGLPWRFSRRCCRRPRTSTSASRLRRRRSTRLGAGGAAARPASSRRASCSSAPSGLQRDTRKRLPGRSSERGRSGASRVSDWQTRCGAVARAN